MEKATPKATPKAVVSRRLQILKRRIHLLLEDINPSTETAAVVVSELSDMMTTVETIREDLMEE